MRALAVVVVLLAGCLSIEGPNQDEAEPDFVTSAWRCGFVPAGTICEHAWITADREVWVLQGSASTGTGLVNFDGPHPGLSAGRAKALLGQAGIYQTDRDFLLRDSFGGVAREDEMTHLLHVAQAFYATPAEHNRIQNIADAGTRTLMVNTTTDGTSRAHASSAYGDVGDAAYEGLRDAVDDVLDRLGRELGIRSAGKA